MISPASLRVAVSSSRGATVSTTTFNCASSAPSGRNVPLASTVRMLYQYSPSCGARNTNEPLSGLTLLDSSQVLPWLVDTWSCTSTGGSAGGFGGSIRKG